MNTVVRKQNKRIVDHESLHKHPAKLIICIQEHVHERLKMTERLLCQIYTTKIVIFLQENDDRNFIESEIFTDLLSPGKFIFVCSPDILLPSSFRYSH